VLFHLQFQNILNDMTCLKTMKWNPPLRVAYVRTCTDLTWTSRSSQLPSQGMHRKISLTPYDALWHHACVGDGTNTSHLRQRSPYLCQPFGCSLRTVVMPLIESQCPALSWMPRHYGHDCGTVHADHAVSRTWPVTGRQGGRKGTWSGRVRPYRSHSVIIPL
jgi:hypothetical protein